MAAFSKVFKPKARSMASGPNFLGRAPEHFTRPVDLAADEQTLLFMMCSLLLDYPHDGADDVWATVDAQVDALPKEPADRIRNFITAAQQTGVREMQKAYVETFDQRRRCSMFLSYYSVGDTRQRGTAILAFKQQLEALGFYSEREELPDHLCVLLEAAAKANSEHERKTMTEILASHRDGLEVLRTALDQLQSPYAGLVEAVCMALPDVDQETVDNYINLIRSGPPAELVGLGTPLPFAGAPAATT